MENRNFKNPREFVIALNKTTGLIEVLPSKQYLESPHNKYICIDDSTTEYKARIKAKEIKFMGVNRYIDMAARKAVLTS